MAAMAVMAAAMGETGAMVGVTANNRS